MTTIQRIPTALMLAALLNSSGCAPEATKPQDATFTVVYEDAHCPFNEKRLQVLHSVQEVQSLFAAAPALKTSIGATASVLPNGLRDALASANFATHTWVLVAWGAQPNPGYRPVAADNHAHFANGTLQLPLRLQTPAAGNMFAQVVVTPCQLVSIAQSLPVERIELQ
jgi:hypothetical protein